MMYIYNIYICMHAVANSVQKPGPVFLAMGREAYNLGAEFMYRVGW
jgi:hypothetical protein